MTDFETVLNMNKTTDTGVSPEFTGVLQRYLLDNVHNNLIYEQFGDKVKVEKGKTNHVAWDRVNQLPSVTTALAEGVTPTGSKITMERIEGSAVPYGDYLAFTDEFEEYSMDPPKQLIDKTGILSDQATATFDELAGKVLASGTNVQYTGSATKRGDVASSLTIADVRKAVRTLKGNKAPKLNGDYIAIVHTDVAHDLMSDSDWKTPHMYSDTKELYNGEIGMLYGVRFVETPTGVKFEQEPFLVSTANVTSIDTESVSADKKTIYLADYTLTQADCDSLITRGFYFGNNHYDIKTATPGAPGTNYITVETAVSDLSAGDTLIADGGTDDGKPVYPTLVFGANAFGITSLGDNLEVIYKGLGVGEDPLNQRSTLGWKARFLAKILQPLYLVRIESLASRYA